MTDSLPWADLADSDETFLRFYHAFEPDCRRRVARRYRTTALRWKLCPEDYDGMVADAVHDSFLKVRHLWGRASADTHRPLAWLVAVAYGCLRDQLRYAIRRQARRASLDTVEHHVVPSLPAAVDRVHETLTCLSPRQAHALHSHYLGGKTLLELSHELDVSPTAVHSLLQRSRHRFRELWVVTEDVPTPTSGGAV